MAQNKLKLADCNATTGTGSFVFATSPTLTTPVLGTPSSGTLTNCTGLPLAGITSSTSTALGVGSLELGHASDTTLARVSAGVMSVEGVRVITSASTTANTVLKNNGTTFVASTETYAAPGTSGNVMTSDGTNWTSAAAAAGGSTTAIDSKMSTYWTMQLPWYNNGTAQNDWTGTPISYINRGNYNTATSECTGQYISLVSNNTNAYVYQYLHINPGGGVYSFNSTKALVASFLFKTASTNTVMFGLGTSNASYYTNTTLGGTCRAMFAYTAGTTLKSLTENNVGTLVTNTLTAPTMSNWNLFRIEWDPASAVRFYVNGTLVATHTTSLPGSSGSQISIGCGVDTTTQTVVMSIPTVSVAI